MNLFWLLCGGKNIPSARIHGINIHNKLKELKYSSFLAHMPDCYSEDLVWSDFVKDSFVESVNSNDIVLIQKLNGKKMQSVALELQRKGVKLIFIDCDLPVKSNMASLCKLLILPSNALANEYSYAGFDHSIVILDAVEFFRHPEQVNHSSRKMVWFGKSGAGKWDVIQDFKKNVIPKIAPNWELILVSDHSDADVPWSINSYHKIISQFDLAVIPLSGSKEELVKSANRCTQSMALGLPVVASDILSYREVVRNFENGLVSNSLDEWKHFFKECEDIKYLNKVKRKAYFDSTLYSINKIIDFWIKYLVISDAFKQQKFKYLYLKIKMSIFLSYSRYPLFRSILK